MWGDSSEFKSENNIKGSVSDGLHVRNKAILNDEKNVVFEDSYVDTLCTV